MSEMAWWHDLWQTLRSIGAIDMIDILLMASLLYLVLLWFKRTKAAFVARGIFVFVLVYVIAKQAGMYLTTWAFQGFITVFLVALVVIFQEELRSFFERVALWSIRKRMTGPPPPETAEILVRMADQFARARIGALFVLKGQDPLERHLEGGEELDGKLSELLLESLFDPHSGGHDGAVVIAQGRVVCFGTHLPLSSEFNKLTRRGTRHAAALGLAERTDALCVVVSEERGQVSVAQRGELTTVSQLEGLEARIGAFLRTTTPAKSRLRWRDVLQRNAIEKIVSLGMTLALWLVFVQGYSPTTQVFQVPIETRAIPAQLRVQTMSLTTAEVTLKGLSRHLELLNPLRLRVALDLAQAQAGTWTLPMTAEQIQVPGAVRVVQVNPTEIELTVTEANTPGLFGLFGGAGRERTESLPTTDAGHETTTP